MDKKLIVISPRWNKLCEWAALWLAPRPGTEELLIHAMARVVADAELLDTTFLDGRADGGTEYLESLADEAFSLAEVSRATGVPDKDIVAAAYLYATGGKSSGPVDLPEPSHPSNLPTARLVRDNAAASVEQTEEAVLAEGVKAERPAEGYPPSTIIFPAAGPYTLSPTAVAALTNLALITGNIGREGAGINPLVTGTNCMGANDMGAQPEYFPGYRPVNADNAREMEGLWTVSPDPLPPRYRATPASTLGG
jgi:formate dehydrogenase major subunit/formate dehydrogenase alpha subunit